MPGKRWEFDYHPVMADRAFPKPGQPKPGDRVVLTDLGPGVRRHQSYAHVSDADGNPLGLVLKQSLQRISRMRGGNPHPEETDRLASVFTDRRVR